MKWRLFLVICQTMIPCCVKQALCFCKIQTFTFFALNVRLHRVEKIPSVQSLVETSSRPNIWGAVIAWCKKEQIVLQMKIIKSYAKRWRACTGLNARARNTYRYQKGISIQTISLFITGREKSLIARTVLSKGSFGLILGGFEFWRFWVLDDFEVWRFWTAFVANLWRILFQKDNQMQNGRTEG